MPVLCLDDSCMEPVVLKLLFSPTAQVCPLPPMVSHGDFICHPRPCERYNHGTVVEFYCDPGYSLTSDYKYITCQYGEWFPSYQVYCIKSGKTGGRVLRSSEGSLQAVVRLCPEWYPLPPCHEPQDQAVESDHCGYRWPL